MKGLVTIKGNMGLAMKLNMVLTATRKYMIKMDRAAKPAAAVSAPVEPTDALDSNAIFLLLGDVVTKDGDAMAKKMKSMIQFDITGAGQWHLDLKSAAPALTKGSKKADVTVIVSDADFVAIALGKLNAQQVRW